MISGRFGLGLYATADVALRAIGTFAEVGQGKRIDLENSSVCIP